MRVRVSAIDWYTDILRGIGRSATVRRALPHGFRSGVRTPWEIAKAGALLSRLAEFSLDRARQQRVLGRDIGCEAAHHVATPIHQKLLEVPHNVGVVAGSETVLIQPLA